MGHTTEHGFLSYADSPTDLADRFWGLKMGPKIISRVRGMEAALERLSSNPGRIQLLKGMHGACEPVPWAGRLDVQPGCAK